MNIAELRATNTMNLLNNKYTPDFPELLDHRFQLFFVVDSLMRGCKDHLSLKKTSSYGCRAYTSPGFECYKEELTDTVVPFGSGRRPDPVSEKKSFCRVKGEVHLVETGGIPSLDTMKRNGVQFIRRRIDLLVPYRDYVMMEIGNEEILKQLPSGSVSTRSELGIRHYISDEMVCKLTAWMYTAKKDYWYPLINGMSFNHLTIKESNRPWLLRYYQFNKNGNT